MVYAAEIFILTVKRRSISLICCSKQVSGKMVTVNIETLIEIP